jgi:hypothetical protein
MTPPAGHNQPKPIQQVNGFKVGDRVVTPLGRIARITGFRQDGYIDAEYEGWHSREGSVPLQPHTLRKKEGGHVA